MTFSFRTVVLTTAACLAASSFWAQSESEAESMPADSSKVYVIVEQVPIGGSCGVLTGKEAGTCT
ncbi:MAG: hypothetical protein ACPGYM_02560 [Flavobacteriales bacterium]